MWSASGETGSMAKSTDVLRLLAKHVDDDRRRGGGGDDDDDDDE